ncbi:MAG: hypothetical protein KJP15_07200 [Gammaproteobacteria bacterium]|nr:hypothetical protein [Gammaproteobacteria bacterium]
MPSSSESPLSSLLRIGPYLFLAVSLAVVIVFILLGQYAHPSSDDFCLAAGVNRHGLLTEMWNHYFEWSGRYTGNALYAIYPLVFGLFEGYRYIPVLIIVSLFLASAFFVATVFRIRMFSAPVWLSSLGFVVVYLLGLMSPASSLYWMAGALSYQTANILLLVILGLMIQLARQQQQGRPHSLQLVMLMLLVVTAMGANETSMLAISLVSLLCFIIYIRSGWTRLKPWLLILAITLICFAIVYFSPGNAVRTVDFPLRHDFVRAVSGSVSVGLKVLGIWLSNPVLIVSSLLAPFAIIRLERVPAGSIRVKDKEIALLLLCTLMLPIVLQFPAWWAMGGWPPARTLDAIYFLFLLGWYATLVAVTLRVITPAADAVALRASTRVTLALALLSLLFTAVVLMSPGIQRMKHDLFQTAGPWSAYMHQRYQQVHQAVENGQLNLTVADYQQEYPSSIYFNDIMHNSRHWRNRCYADYFGLEKIRRDRSENSLDRKRIINQENSVTPYL